MKGLSVVVGVTGGCMGGWLRRGGGGGGGSIMDQNYGWTIGLHFGDEYPKSHWPIHVVIHLCQKAHVKRGSLIVVWINIFVAVVVQVAVAQAR